MLAKEHDIEEIDELLHTLRSQQDAGEFGYTPDFDQGGS